MVTVSNIHAAASSSVAILCIHFIASVASATLTLQKLGAAQGQFDFRTSPSAHKATSTSSPSQLL
jgi:hypothetical protein